MDIEKVEKIGVVLGIVVVSSMTILSFIYFLQEDPEAIPLAFLPVGVAAIYFYLAKLQGKPVKIIPQSSLEFVFTNLGFLILYLGFLFAVTGYLYMKVTFLVLYLFIVGYTSWGYVAKNLRRK